MLTFRDIARVVDRVGVVPVRVVGVRHLDGYGIPVTGVVPGDDDFVVVRVVVIVVVIVGRIRLVVRSGGVLLVGVEI